MDLTVVTGTFGDQDWIDLAHARAGACAQRLGLPWIHLHADTLADARNGVIDQVTTKWLVILDADDELKPGFVGAMEKGSADVRAPWLELAAFPTHKGRAMGVPRVPLHVHDFCDGVCLVKGDPSIPGSNGGNWLVIGSVVRTDLAQQVRFRDWPVYEDFDFWQRCYLAGASFEPIPDAIYRAYTTRRGRNASLPLYERNLVHEAICRANGVAMPSLR